MVLRDAPRLEYHFGVIELGQLGDLYAIDLGDELVEPLAPLGVELVPVLVVIAGALLKNRESSLGLLRIRYGVGRDVDAAVENAVVDTQCGRKCKHARG